MKSSYFEQQQQQPTSKMAANTDRIFMAEQIKVRIIFQYYFNTITTTNQSPLHITQLQSTATQFSLTSLNNTIFQQQNSTYTQKTN